MEALEQAVQSAKPPPDVAPRADAPEAPAPLRHKAR
jgi:hypothetical protein